MKTTKTWAEKLESFKKSNKDARLIKAQKEGFTSADDYKIFLEREVAKEKSPITPTKTVKTKTVKASKPSKSSGTSVEKEELTDMVVAFDTTGSMMSYINNVKKHVKELIPRLLKQNPGLKISVVAFGDYCDMTSAKVFGKAYQVLGLTNDEKELIKFVTGAQNTNGGDGDEFYELVIKKIVEETQWRPGSNKSVLFIGDHEPHAVGYSYGGIVQNSQIDWKQEAEKAKKAGIVFDTLRIHPTIKWYQRLADITGGVCLDFKNSSKMGQVVEASSLARGGAATKDAFFAMSASVENSGDAEMTSVYSMYKTVVEKK